MLFADDARWYSALTLEERHRLISNVPTDAPPDPTRARQWCNRSYFDDALVRARLVASSMTEPSFDRATSLSAAELRQRTSEVPSWLSRTGRAFRRDRTAQSREQSLGLLAVIDPLLAEARSELQLALERTRRHAAREVTGPELIGPLMAELEGQLFQMLVRVVLVELAASRKLGLLRGSTANERFAYFAHYLSIPAIAHHLLAGYPVLCRLLSEHIALWLGSIREFCEHLIADWGAIEQRFGKLSRVIEAKASGDSHSHGRRVRVLRCAGGEALVYKPRAMGLDVHFEQLLSWLNRELREPLFRGVGVLDCGDHGWVEHVAHTGCASAGEVERFFERQGANLALLHALGANDFHGENLIACGEFPVLIDLETVLQPQQPTMRQPGATEFARALLSDSVWAVGLLPRRVWGRDDRPGIDLTGLGWDAGAQTPFDVSCLEDVGLDSMHMTRRPATLEAARNTPTLLGQAVGVADYAARIDAGFERVYRALSRRKAELAAPSGVLSPFSGDQVRVVLRNTYGYARLLSESYHPDLLRDALDRDRNFDQLWASVPALPHLANTCAAEQRALWRGDVPLFWAHADSCTLRGEDLEPLESFLETSALARARDRIRRLDADDLERQRWLIAVTLARPTAVRAPRAPRRRGRAAVGTDRATSLALRLGEHIAARALRRDDQASWWVADEIADGLCQPRAADLDLYGGLPGIALFLAYLADVTHEGRYRELAEAAVRTVCAELGGQTLVLGSLGAFCGVGGLIYSLTHLGALWGSPALLERADDLAARMDALLSAEAELDIVSGAAGAIGSLLCLHAVRRNDASLGMARRCGQHLVSRLAETSLDLDTGFAHGLSGLAWALESLAAVSGERHFHTAARAALERESARLDADRDPSAPVEEAALWSRRRSWCRGTAGAALARLPWLASGAPERFSREADAIVQGLLGDEARVVEDDCLCHGAAGQWELLLQAERLGLIGEQRNAWLARQSSWLRKLETSAPLCGTPAGVETLGLMDGLAGIGLQLLRLSQPWRVPSVLVLEAPIAPVGLLPKAR